MNPRPPGYEPDELPDCSTPRYPSKALRSDGKNNYSTFRRACQPVRQKFPDTLQKTRRSARPTRDGSAPTIASPGCTQKARHSRPQIAEKACDGKTAPIKTRSSSLSRLASLTTPSFFPLCTQKARHPRPQGAENARKTAPVQNRLTVASPSPPRFARKRRGHPAAAAPSFAGDQALILRMAIAVTCVGAALVPAVALS